MPNAVQIWAKDKKEKLIRKRRIIGRLINNKALPQYTYRWDARDAAAIGGTGFQPWLATGNVTIIEHVNNSYAVGHPLHGVRTPKNDSQFVSTGAYSFLEHMDAIFTQRAMTFYLYKIDTQLALATGLFYDVNDTFDRANQRHTYRSQREWLKDGGITPNAIVASMYGPTFMAQCNIDAQGLHPPTEANLAQWTAFPQYNGGGGGGG